MNFINDLGDGLMDRLVDQLVDQLKNDLVDHVTYFFGKYRFIFRSINSRRQVVTQHQINNQISERWETPVLKQFLQIILFRHQWRQRQ
jgi:hypothetical protein